MLDEAIPTELFKQFIYLQLRKIIKKCLQKSKLHFDYWLMSYFSYNSKFSTLYFTHIY